MDGLTDSKKMPDEDNYRKELNEKLNKQFYSMAIQDMIPRVSLIDLPCPISDDVLVDIGMRSIMNPTPKELAKKFPNQKEWIEKCVSADLEERTNMINEKIKEIEIKLDEHRKNKATYKNDFETFEEVEQNMLKQIKAFEECLKVVSDI